MFILEEQQLAYIIALSERLTLRPLLLPEKSGPHMAAPILSYTVLLSA